MLGFALGGTGGLEFVSHWGSGAVALHRSLAQAGSGKPTADVRSSRSQLCVLRYLPDYSSTVRDSVPGTPVTRVALPALVQTR